MKKRINPSFLSAILIALENWMWGAVSTEQMGMSPNEARQMIDMFSSPADNQFEWASHFAYYKETDDVQ
jgi:hypothetical protein